MLNNHTGSGRLTKIDHRQSPPEYPTHKAWAPLAHAADATDRAGLAPLGVIAGTHCAAGLHTGCRPMGGALVLLTPTAAPLLSYSFSYPFAVPTGSLVITNAPALLALNIISPRLALPLKIS
ncbi:hypothetical protein AERO9A_220004 [Aeromonas salmonicida]|nr:hypothetical protein AERO9A_220004 [Aeromonas salmonicida]